MLSFLLIAALSYLLGSVPFGYLLVRIFRGHDVRQSGSGNIGATNVSRTSPALGILTLLLDALKGTAAVALSYRLGDRMVAGAPAHELLASAALFATVGHIFPVWLKFRGGKGVATGLGAFILLAPRAALVAVAVFIAIVLVSRYVSLGSIGAVAAFPVSAWLLHEYGDRPLALGLMSLTSLLIIARHRENIQRLLAGTENRLASRRA
jgi:acyl phosphate:glycerol-3-phosphate acyltransferase